MTDAGRGASRLIPPEFCVVRWMQLGSAQSIAIRGSAGDGYRRPRFFLRSKRARGGGPGGEEAGAAGAQRWFRRALRWRAGCEATISTVKHPLLDATSHV
jgi:hypothetical protein